MQRNAKVFESCFVAEFALSAWQPSLFRRLSWLGACSTAKGRLKPVLQLPHSTLFRTWETREYVGSGAKPADFFVGIPERSSSHPEIHVL